MDVSQWVFVPYLGHVPGPRADAKLGALSNNPPVPWPTPDPLVVFMGYAAKSSRYPRRFARFQFLDSKPVYRVKAKSRKV